MAHSRPVSGTKLGLDAAQETAYEQTHAGESEKWQPMEKKPVEYQNQRGFSIFKSYSVSSELA